MTLLMAEADLEPRRSIAASQLSALARSLRTDLDRLVGTPEIWLPVEKARLTRLGGRCPDDGMLLGFDPWSPWVHLCPACGREVREDVHHQWWVMNYHLWLSERAVHAAVLAVLADDVDCRVLAERILEAYAARYLEWPNRDNVLGPSRPFFSTYLESIWLLQLASALSHLELGRPPGAWNQAVRDRLLEPSAALIGGFNEGDSNRQVWNAAAVAAAARLLDRPADFEAALLGGSGLAGLLARGLLADGTWYEGENYHLFAHRGLWYGVRMARTAGLGIPVALERRFMDGFLAPFLTALPDLTFPARRDSQYRVSLRQWRVAESCELGLASGGDERLEAALGVLYSRDVPRGETGRATSTGEADRHVPPVRLDRAALGWKCLVAARPEPPSTREWAPRSVHLPAQGFAVFRRERGRTYVALDYGTVGGGHGHADRLNLWFVHGEHRVLEDVGTGSYVDRTLSWYRSTLAHNAPMSGGASQPRHDGRLVAIDEQGPAGWVSAAFDLDPGRASVVRRVVVMDGYFVDQVEWRAPDDTVVDLPVHTDLPAGGDGEWQVAPGGFPARSGSGVEFVTRAERIDGTIRGLGPATGGLGARAWVHAEGPHEWWRLWAPGPPRYGPAGTAMTPDTRERPFLVVRGSGGPGRVTMVWTWDTGVIGASFGDGDAVVRVRLAPDREDVHSLQDGTWCIEERTPAQRRTVHLDGRRPGAEGQAPDGQAATHRPAAASPSPRGAAAPFPLAPREPFVLEMARAHYRRSEEPWERAGAPTASLRVSVTSRDLVVNCLVRKWPPVFASPRDENPLDNEHPDVNSDGLQVYLTVPGSRFEGSWIMVPEPGGEHVRVTPRRGDAIGLSLRASWSGRDGGYGIRVALDRGDLGLADGGAFCLNVVVNEISADRERRRGQLVALGAEGEWTYLRGDREDPVRMLTFLIRE